MGRTLNGTTPDGMPATARSCYHATLTAVCATAEMPLSRSLPAGLPQQQQPPQQQQQPQQSVFARLDGNAAAANGVAHQHLPQQQPHQQPQPHGSVWDRLSGAQPQTAAEANGNVWRRLGPSAGQQQQQQQQLQLQRPGSLDGKTQSQCSSSSESVSWQGALLPCLHQPYIRAPLRRCGTIELASGCETSVTT
jgi:hypothetical protein